MKTKTNSYRDEKPRVYDMQSFLEGALVGVLTMILILLLATAIISPETFIFR